MSSCPYTNFPNVHCSHPLDRMYAPAATTPDDYVCCDYDQNAKRYYETGYSQATCQFTSGYWVPRSQCKVSR